jgi:phage shock protein A
MGLLKRIRGIVNANLNELLDKVESPEAMVNQMIREMEQAILEVRRETAAAIARRKMTEKRAHAAEAEAAKWHGNAVAAVAAGDDDLARQALGREHDAHRRVEALHGELAGQTELVERLKAELQAVQDKVQEVRRKRDTLVSKRQAAEARERLLNSVDRADRTFDRVAGAHDHIINGFDDLAGWEDRIDQRLFEVEAREELRVEAKRDDLAASFADGERSRRLDDALRRLKEEAGAGNP